MHDAGTHTAFEFGHRAGLAFVFLEGLGCDGGDQVLGLFAASLHHLRLPEREVGGHAVEQLAGAGELLEGLDELPLGLEFFGVAGKQPPLEIDVGGIEVGGRVRRRGERSRFLRGDRPATDAKGAGQEAGSAGGTERAPAHRAGRLGAGRWGDKGKSGAPGAGQEAVVPERRVLPALTLACAFGSLVPCRMP